MEKLYWALFRLFWLIACSGLIFITLSDILYIVKIIPVDLFAFICSFIPFDQSFFVESDDNSARYLLSAITQAKAAIIALVVTLTLIAVQLASQTYSQRIIGLFRSFKKNYPFWLLLFLYSVSIMYDVTVLGIVDKGMDYSLKYRLSFAIFLTGFALIALVPYTRSVMDNLYPSNVIDQIISELDLDPMKESLNLEGELDEVVRVVVVIIKRAINNDDVATSKFGIEKLEKCFKKLFNFALKKQNGNEEGLVRYFCYHFGTIGDRATFREDGESVIEVCRALEKIGNLTVEGELDGATLQVVESLEWIGTAAIEKRLDFATRRAELSLGEVGVDAAEKGLDGATRGATNSLCRLSVVFIQHKKDTKDLIKSLVDIHQKSHEIVKKAIERYESNLKKEGDKSKLKAFQTFKKQLGFLSKSKSKSISIQSSREQIDIVRKNFREWLEAF